MKKNIIVTVHLDDSANSGAADLIIRQGLALPERLWLLAKEIAEANSYLAEHNVSVSVKGEF